MDDDPGACTKKWMDNNSDMFCRTGTFVVVAAVLLLLLLTVIVLIWWRCDDVKDARKESFQVLERRYQTLRAGDHGQGGGENSGVELTGYRFVVSIPLIVYNLLGSATTSDSFTIGLYRMSNGEMLGGGRLPGSGMYSVVSLGSGVTLRPDTPYLLAQVRDPGKSGKHRCMRSFDPSDITRGGGTFFAEWSGAMKFRGDRPRDSGTRVSCSPELGLEYFPMVPNWSDTVTGRVGEPGVLNESGQELVRRQIDEANAVDKGACRMNGVEFSPEWRNSDLDSRGMTCVTDMTNLAVRNNCSKGNRVLDHKVVDQVFIDSKTHKCNVAIREDASRHDLEDYKDQIGIVSRITEQTQLTHDYLDKLRSTKRTLEDRKARYRKQIGSRQSQINSYKANSDLFRRMITRHEKELKNCNKPSKPMKPKLVGARAGNGNTSGTPRGSYSEQFFCEHGSMPRTVYRIAAVGDDGTRSYGSMKVATSSYSYKAPVVRFYTDLAHPVTGKVVLQDNSGGRGWRDVKTVTFNNADDLNFGCVRK